MFLYPVLFELFKSCFIIQHTSMKRYARKGSCIWHWPRKICAKHFELGEKAWNIFLLSDGRFYFMLFGAIRRIRFKGSFVSGSSVIKRRK